MDTTTLLSYVAKASYFLAAVLFILGIKRMASPVTARKGIVQAGIGMVVATLATFVWSNTRGFPASVGPFVGGARDEARFKHWVRLESLPAPFVYSAYPELSVSDVRRGAALRALLAGKPDEASARRALELV